MKKVEGREIAVWIFVVLLSVSTALLIYFSSFKAIAFDEAYYEEKFVEFDIRSRFNSSVNLTFENHRLLEYLENGEGRIDSGFFKEREVIHLEEVLVLYGVLFKIMNYLIFGSIVLILLLMYFFGRAIVHHKDEKKYLRTVMSRLLFGIGIAVFVLFGFFLFMVVTFDDSFITFHEVLFPTDTWMLDPAEHNLINMFPQQFFEDIFTKIIVSSLLYGCVLLVGGGVVRYGKRKFKDQI